MIKVSIPGIRQTHQYHVLSNMIYQKAQSLLGILAKNAQSKSNHEKTSDKAKLRCILQNNWHVQNVKFMGDERRLRNGHRLEEPT